MRISRLLIVLAPLALLVAPQVVQASESQNGADMVIINPGGGQEEDGSDGLLSVFNGEDTSSPNFFDDEFEFATELGSDEQFFASTPQWCCTGVSPMLYAGTPTIAPLDPDDFGSWPAPASTLVGEAGAAFEAASWSTTGGGVEIVSTSGAVVRVPAGQAGTEFPAGAPTGSGSAVIRYTAIVGGLTYVIERSISYTYPNNFYNEIYTFTVPSGNTDPVEFYLGGDAAPGDSDNGRGALTTSPNRVLYEINPDSEIFIAYGEVGSPAISPFSSGYVAAFDEPAYYSIERGYSLTTGCGVYPSQQVVDTNFCIDNDEHDAGLNIQWTIPATPGTYTRQMRTIVGFQGVSVSARFTPSSVSSGQSSNLEIELVSTDFDPVSGVGFSLALPAGLTISGAATNSCDGTLTAASGGTSVALTGGDVEGGANCLVSVPVTGAVGSYTVYDQDFEDLAPLSLTKGFGNSTLEVVAPTEPALTVNRSGTGSGTVTSSPAGIDCGQACTANFTLNSTVTLTATPASGSTFTGWSGSSCSGTGTCAVTMSEAKSITAEFTEDSPPPSGKPNLKVSFNTPKKVTGGKPFTVKVTVTNRKNATSSAKSVKSCLKVPAPLMVVKAKGSKVKGRTVCWTRSNLGIGKSATYPVTLKAPLRTSGRRSLSATVRADNASGQSSSGSGKAKITVKKGKAPKPKPPTG